MSLLCGMCRFLGFVVVRQLLPQLQLFEKGVPVVQAVQVVQACRDAVFVSHGPDFASDHRGSSGHPRFMRRG